MEPFDTKLASLTYLTNPLYQQIIKQQKEIKAASNKSDIKFYRKRISSLTKDMLKGEIPNNDYIKHVYDAYVNGLIKYFKMLDTTDIIQKQYDNTLPASGDPVSSDLVSSDLVSSDLSSGDPASAHDLSAHDLSAHDLLADDLISTADLMIKEVKMNDSLMRKYPGPTTLDNFVIKKKNDSKEVRIIPVILDIDLKEPSLKIKGVKEKVKTSNKNKNKNKSHDVTSTALETINEVSSEIDNEVSIENVVNVENIIT